MKCPICEKEIIEFEKLFRCEDACYVRLKNHANSYGLKFIINEEILMYICIPSSNQAFVSNYSNGKSIDNIKCFFIEEFPEKYKELEKMIKLKIFL